MAYLQTVTGRIDPSEVNFCHSHEHLLLSRGVSSKINSDLLIDDFKNSLEEVQSYMTEGGDTIVEAQPVGCNRVSEGLVRLSKVSGANIIASTGFHKMIFYPNNHWIFTFKEVELYNIFIHELTEGMFIDCDISKPSHFIEAKAGQIKCALDTMGIDEQYGKLFQAAGRAAIDTGLPMMVHIERGSNSVELVDFLDKEGIRPPKLILCHLDRACDDISVHKDIASRGIFLEYDTIGRPKYHSDAYEIEIIQEMVSAGYGSQILCSLDSTKARMISYTPGSVGLTYILKSFIPMLKKAGITESQIKLFMCENPRRAFSHN